MTVDTPKNGFLRLFLFAGIIPAFLLLACWQILTRDHIAAMKQQAIREVRGEIRTIRREGTDDIYLQQALNSLFARISEEGFKAEKLSDIVRDWQGHSFGFINLKFFSPDGEHLKFAGGSDRDRVVTGRIYQALISAETSGTDKSLVLHRTFFENFAGGVLPSEIVNGKSSLIRINRAGFPGYIYWNSFYDHGSSGRLLGGMLAYFASADIPHNIGVKRLIQDKNAWQHDRQFGVVGPDSGAKALWQKILLMQRNFRSELEENGKTLLIEPLSSESVLYCLLDLDSFSAGRADILVKILALLLLVGGGRFAFSLSGEVCIVRLKGFQQIVSMACLLPVVVIFSTGFAYIQLKEQHDISIIREKLNDLVESVDESYELAVGNLAGIYDRICRHEAMINFNKEKMENLVSYLADRDALQRIFLVDSDGEILFGWPRLRADDDVVKKLLPAVARRIFQMHLGIEASLKNKLSDMMVDKMTDGFSEILGDLRSGLYSSFENLNRVNEVWLGKNRYYVFAGFVNTLGKKKSDLLLIWHKTDSFARRYLIRQVRRNLNDSALAYSASLAMMSRRNDEMPFPPELTKYSFPRALSERVKKTGTRQFSIEEKGGERFLVLAHPMMRVPDSILFAMHPLEPMQNEKIWMWLKLALILMCTAFFVRQLVKVAI